MLLSPDEAFYFFKLHKALLQFVNRRRRIVPHAGSDDELAATPLEQQLKVRNAWLEDLSLTDAFVQENPLRLNDEERQLVLSWRQPVVGRFYALRQLKNYMVFLDDGKPPVAYGVVALTDPFEKFFPNLPMLVDLVLLPFKGRIIYDGMLVKYNMTFGGGIKRRLNLDYREAKDRLGIVTSFPNAPGVSAASAAAAKPKSTRQRSQKPPKKDKSAVEVGQILYEINQLTDKFCRRHLNGEYAEYCRELAETLARKRPSPLLRGKGRTWASGIVRTIGWVNFLDDASTSPYLKFAEIDKTLGVSQSSGQAKSLEIRKLLKIGRFNVKWTLPSMQDENPNIWFLSVDGFIVDVRNEPRELQAIAFEKGLIPYIPADRELPAARDPQTDGSAAGLLYQFKITLKNSKPAIWRRIQVEDCTLDKLHEHIQQAMGWTNSHLHQFHIDGQCFGDPQLLAPDSVAEYEFTDSTVTPISAVVPVSAASKNAKKFRFQYEYDFGDGWEHDILFEGNPPADPRQQYPLCLEGERACPPEDCGGIWGFVELLRVLADPDHSEYRDMREWCGPFDPERFDAAEATRQMRQGAPSWR